MTARPIFTERRRWPLIAAVALVLLAIVMAAGCVTQIPENKNRTLSEEKYVVLHYTRNAEFSRTVTGPCWHTQVSYDGSGFSFNESSGVLSLMSSRYGNESANVSMLLFSDSGYNGTYQDPIHTGTFVYSLPADMTGDVTIDTITGDGTLSLRYHDIPVVLKPGERWENSSYIVYSGFNLKPDDCSEEYFVTETFSNAGIFNKNAITVRA